MELRGGPMMTIALVALSCVHDVDWKHGVLCNCVGLYNPLYQDSVRLHSAHVFAQEVET